MTQLFLIAHIVGIIAAMVAPAVVGIRIASGPEREILPRAPRPHLASELRRSIGSVNQAASPARLVDTGPETSPNPSLTATPA